MSKPRNFRYMLLPLVLRIVALVQRDCHIRILAVDFGSVHPPNQLAPTSTPNKTRYVVQLYFFLQVNVPEGDHSKIGRDSGSVVNIICNITREDPAVNGEFPRVWEEGARASGLSAVKSNLRRG
ncbi:hypothetical protein C8R43DRAFT_1010560 [Mycena crocata]|nr:hypothetical protein C8R43DRAFT_1010560 [Mycena crocata]